MSDSDSDSDSNGVRLGVFDFASYAEIVMLKSQAEFSVRVRVSRSPSQSPSQYMTTPAVVDCDLGLYIAITRWQSTVIVWKPELE